MPRGGAGRWRVFLAQSGAGFPLMVLAPVKAELVSPDYYLAFLPETSQWLMWELGVRTALPSSLLSCLEVPCENLWSRFYPSLGPIRENKPFMSKHEALDGKVTPCGVSVATPQPLSACYCSWLCRRHRLPHLHL